MYFHSGNHLAIRVYFKDYFLTGNSVVHLITPLSTGPITYSTPAPTTPNPSFVALFFLIRILIILLTSATYFITFFLFIAP